jgi:hypothetical protein
MDHKTRSRKAVHKGHERVNEWLQGWQDHVKSVREVHDKIVPDPSAAPATPYTTGHALADGVALTVSWCDAAFGWMLPR